MEGGGDTGRLVYVGVVSYLMGNQSGEVAWTCLVSIEMEW